MRTPEQAASLLVTGTLSRSSWPELADEDFGDEVRRRLGEVGLELVAAAGRWLARPRHVETTEGFEPAFELHQVELAVIAALYLHLRYLPSRADDPVGAQDDPSVSVEDVLAPFRGYQRRYLEQMVLGRLRNAGFVVREDRRLYAGPYLAAIDPVEADRRCTEALQSFVLARWLRRRAEEIDHGEDPPADGSRSLDEDGADDAPSEAPERPSGTPNGWAQADRDRSGGE